MTCLLNPCYIGDVSELSLNKKFSVLLNLHRDIVMTGNFRIYELLHNQSQSEFSKLIIVD
jgi:hypothetical protein